MATTKDKAPEFPQRYYDALAEDSLFLQNSAFQAVMRLRLGRSPEPARGQIETFGRLMMVTDPAADAWAEVENRDNRPQWYAQFNQALEEGLDNVTDAPPELIELIRASEQEPSWLDRDLVDLGCDIAQRLGPMQNLVLGNMALMGGYASAPITKPLVFTGALETGTSRRLTETANFGLDVTRHGGLERNKAGFKTALRVRMMHGIIRKRIRNSEGWRSDLWGEPINQADMIVTNLATSYVFITGCRGLGFRFTRKEVEAYLHLWRYVGHLMGIDSSHLPATEDEAIRALYLALKLQSPPDQDSFALGEALKQEPLEEGETLFGKLEEKVKTGFSRFALGGKMSKKLGVPNTPWMIWPLFFTPANFVFETIRQMTPGATRLATWIGGYYQKRDIETRLGGKEAAYVPAVELTDKSKKKPLQMVS